MEAKGSQSLVVVVAAVMKEKEKETFRYRRNVGKKDAAEHRLSVRDANKKGLEKNTRPTATTHTHYPSTGTYTHTIQ